MARDDELRKVAEDIRALARSLAKDFREAVDQSRSGGHPPGEAIRRGLKDVADETKRGMKDTWSQVGPMSNSHWNNKYWQREWARHNRHKARYAKYAKYWVPPASPPGVPGSPLGEPVGGASPPAQPPDAPSWQQHPRHPRRRSSLPPVRRRWDGSTVLGILAVLFGIAWLLSALHVIHVSVEGVVAVGLMLLGASMIVTGRTDWSLSRRSWPVWMGLGLIAVLFATSATYGAGSTLHNISFGDRTVPVTSPTQEISGGFGTLTVDGTNILPGAHLKVANIAGNIRILLPGDTPIRLHARVAGGQICFYGHDLGSGVATTADHIPPGGGNPVTIDVREVFGEINVGGVSCSQ